MKYGEVWRDPRDDEVVMLVGDDRVLVLRQSSISNAPEDEVGSITDRWSGDLPPVDVKWERVDGA